MPRYLVVKATVGVESPDRCGEAFTAAAAAASEGATVSFWLAGEASWFALPGRVEECELPTAVPLRELLTTLIGRSRVTLCKHCAVRRGITPGAVLPSIRMAGAPVFVEECLAASHAVVY
ncbi:MAG: DsrE family protein [Natronosporangium sp.]